MSDSMSDKSSVEDGARLFKSRQEITEAASEAVRVVLEAATDRVLRATADVEQHEIDAGLWGPDAVDSLIESTLAENGVACQSIRETMYVAMLHNVQKEFEEWLAERVADNKHARNNTMPGTEDRYIKAAKLAESENILREWRERRGK